MKSLYSFLILIVIFAGVIYTNPNLFPLERWIDAIMSGEPADSEQRGGEESSGAVQANPARNLTGKWVGRAPQGATYKDNVANPACEYEADLELNLEQRGNEVNGSIRFTVRKVKQLLSVQCLAEPGTTFSFPVNGNAAVTNINFSHPGVPGSFSPTNFRGTFTSDIMSGTFERAPHSGGDLAGLKGEWIVSRSR